MKLLVTGCAGFIGSHLCQKLLEMDHQVIGIDIINDYYAVEQKYYNLEILKKYPNFTFKKEDIIDTTIIEQEKPNIVVHLAAMAGVRYSLENPTWYMRTNIEGHTNLLKQSKDNQVELFVYASSSSVYGNNTEVPFEESQTLNNINSFYALTKKTCEDISKLYYKLYQMPSIGLRFFTVYGPRGRPDMAPFKFLSRISKGETIDKYGLGNSYRDYTYIDDIVDGIIGAIRNKNNRTCQVYNLGNSDTISLNEFIATCEEVCQRKAIINQMPDQLGDVPATFANIAKAKADLDYQPKTKLAQGLAKTYQWLKNYSSDIIFNPEVDNILKSIGEKISNGFENKTYRLPYEITFDLPQLVKFCKVYFGQVTVLRSKSYKFNVIHLINKDKIMIVFEDEQYEMMNKGLENEVLLDLN